MLNLVSGLADHVWVFNLGKTTAPGQKLVGDILSRGFALSHF